MYTTLSLLDYAISIIHTGHIYALPIALADNEVSLRFFRITRQCYNERINKARQFHKLTTVLPRVRTCYIENFFSSLDYPNHFIYFIYLRDQNNIYIYVNVN